MLDNEYFLDVQGLGCPEPVVRVKRALDDMSNGTLYVTANSSISNENILRFAKKAGYEASSEEKGDGCYHIKIIKDESYVALITGNSLKNNTTILVTNDVLGERNTLGEKLLRTFLRTLLDTDRIPDKIIFVNQGVFLTTKEENKDTIECLCLLEAKGVEIYSCSTCLEFFGLTEQLKVGKVGNAFETMNSLLQEATVVF
ncbi:sulfurtransferase-like selenium metabolism protein YedF [Helicobacter monodelphidis]|uniref:sulfurtransferase-like selenium metabolism protein YedF n=1 Tax=Helicobacter sp. 15-1451 TaxID=2004995 RepID=UPI000DCBAD72|nr:sulfurtransferase-like selenium metabolism protein YedF [Helicobacter sp. 15-1451]RAX59274.1 sulfurtransferase-like selenium metabolism protein YedF [Helicobacter sp. 15-1451]